MKKRIENVYDYGSYQLLLTDDFAKRVAFNNSYSLRSYANDIGVSVSFLSKIINNKNDLTSTTGEKVFKKLGFYLNENLEINSASFLA